MDLDEEFEQSLTELMAKDMPTLKETMKKPEKKTKVVIVDDYASCMLGMKIILKAWPNISVLAILQEPREELIIPETDILLLDEDMRDLTGTEVAKKLKSQIHCPLIASTTGLDKPAYTDWQFKRKNELIMPDNLKNHKISYQFIEFMNKLLQEIEKSRTKN